MFASLTDAWLVSIPFTEKPTQPKSLGLQNYVELIHPEASWCEELSQMKQTLFDKSFKFVVIA